MTHQIIFAVSYDDLLDPNFIRTKARAELARYKETHKIENIHNKQLHSIDGGKEGVLVTMVFDADDIKQIDNGNE